MVRAFTTVYVNKGRGGYAVHLGQMREVLWTDGVWRTQWMPACGSRVDASALEHTHGEPAGTVTCARCIKKFNLYSDVTAPGEDPSGTRCTDAAGTD